MKKLNHKVFDLNCLHIIRISKVHKNGYNTTPFKEFVKMNDGIHSSNRKIHCVDLNSAFKTTIVSTVMGADRKGRA